MWHHGRLWRKDDCSRARALFSEYLDGRLSAADGAQVEAHLGACRECREELESLRATVAVLRALPEVAPSRSFAVVPVRPAPARRALPALRFATAGVVLLLAAAFAVDVTNVTERDAGQADTFGAKVPDGSYWAVDGVKNSVDAEEETPVTLVVPDSTDNAYEAVRSLSTDGMLYAAIRANSDYSGEVVWTTSAYAISEEDLVEEFALVSPASENTSGLAAGAAAVPSPLDTVLAGQDGSYLNMLRSDNNALYSFDLSGSEKVAAARYEPRWLRYLEFGLAGLAVVLGGGALAAWLLRRRAARAAS